VRPFIIALVFGAVLEISACGPLQPAKPDPLKFSSAEHFLRTDRVKMKLDLSRELEDAEAGRNGPNDLPACYNLVQNVNVDIARMDNFAAGAVTDDATALQNDIAQMRAERADFTRDINDFVNDGIARPAEGPLVAALTDAIGDAKNAADGTIMAIQAELNAAHSSAKRLATGFCSSDAPASAPTIPHVN